MLYISVREMSSDRRCNPKELPEEARTPWVPQRALGKARGQCGKEVWLEVHLRRYLSRWAVCKGRRLELHLQGALSMRAVGTGRWPSVYLVDTI